MKQVILLSLLILLTISCGRTSKQNQNAEMQTETQTEVQPIEQITGTISETQKFEMFCTALANHSTAPNFVVVTVKNLNTGEVKEICTETPFLSGAIYRQTGKFSYSTNCKDYPNRYFEFSVDSALWNISFDLYAISELEKYATIIDINGIVQQIKNGTLIEKTFGFDDGQTFDWEKTHKEQIMFAHIMFNNGVMMTRGCEAGNISSLKYFEQKDE